MTFFKNQSTIRVDENTQRTILAVGDGLMNVLVKFDKRLDEKSPIPTHHHVHEQTTFVLRGSFLFTVEFNGKVETQRVKSGDAISFPSCAEHGCIPLEDESELIDSFTPIREDFL